ncbi:acetylornithine deacetylase [Octadecabacter sp. 1_MG-2023]|uniref:acetylornithine deacetylase n=1 Tax=unclassified Octadecabacter TaxID=196158 RepID=UPI001C09070B|nr:MULTISPECIES: acetylornithine deacetylase [unclassified Octadecabacter]MBU2993845.1 acetylornithine deacetylase [Octadecabacter sp. B2R22]MDO6735309.1 acetylornithine deacetylase [Octadecabacter sp. 1_MG-2023]
MKPIEYRTIEHLRHLVGFASVSADSNLDLIAWLSDRFEALGARVFLDHDPSGTKANLFATLGPETTGGILLSGHTDVVPVTDQDWTSDPFDVIQRNDRLYGRGTCDMKGFIAACLAVAETIDAHTLTRPLHFAFTYDEEVGCLGARALVAVLRDKGLVPDITIIGEPTEMRIIEGHKGCCEYTAEFVGLEGHGSAPDLGVNAAEYATRYVTRLLELRQDLIERSPPDSPFDPPWSTINIGRISGGVAHNVIAGKAVVDWEMRPVQVSDLDFVKSVITRFCSTDLLPAMQAISPEASISVTTIGEVAGLVPMPQNAARDLVAKLTGTNGADLVAFSTEAGLFQAIGSDVVVCGPGSIRQAHKPDEYLEVDQLNACVAMLTALADHIS